MVYIALSDSKYLGKAVEMPKEKKGPGKEWFEAIVFAVFAATFIRWVFMEAYVIPTPSMERSLLIKWLFRVLYLIESPSDVPCENEYQFSGSPPK